MKRLDFVQPWFSNFEGLIGVNVRVVEEIPPAVLRASREDWGVRIDAYLINAAKVGDRFAASVFLDHAGAIENGETVVTPPLRSMSARGEFRLMQSVCGQDHYIIVSEYRAGRLLPT